MKTKDFLDAMCNVNIGSDAENRILNRTMNYVNKKERVTMSKKKICAIAIAAVLAMGIAVYAATGGGLIWYSSSSAVPEYDSCPGAKDLKKDIGYIPVIIEEFENGYIFDDASIMDNTLADDNNQSIEKFKSITVRYHKGSDELILSADKFNTEVELSGNIIDTVDGIDLYYNSYTNKVVPPDYKMTPEDKKAEESGELIFSWGSSEVYISRVQGLTWLQDGIQYNFTQIDGALSESELCDMAKEIINK